MAALDVRLAPAADREAIGGTPAWPRTRRAPSSAADGLHDKRACPSRQKAMGDMARWESCSPCVCRVHRFGCVAGKALGDRALPWDCHGQCLPPCQWRCRCALGRWRPSTAIPERAMTVPVSVPRACHTDMRMRNQHDVSSRAVEIEIGRRVGDYSREEQERETSIKQRPCLISWGSVSPRRGSAARGQARTNTGDL